MATGSGGGSGDGRRGGSAGLESQAAAFFQQGSYEEAARLYSQCLANNAGRGKKETRLGLLFNRAATYTKLKQYEKALEDCETVLVLDPGNSKALNRKIKAQCSLGRFTEAHQTATFWLSLDSTNSQAKKEEERLSLIVSALQDQDEEDCLLEDTPSVREERIPPEGREDEAATQSPNAVTLAASKATTSPPLSPTASSSTPDEDVPPTLHPCTTCDITFHSPAELTTHCQSDLHKKKASSDDGHDWKHRPPPRGLTGEEYTKCPRYFGEGTCRFGERCSQAHSEAELNEWRERFEFRRQRLQHAKDNDLHSNTYAEQLLERWMNAENPESIMTDNLEGINVHINADTTITMATKRSSYAWMFTVTSKVCLRRVVLLDDASRCNFHLASVTVGPKRAQKSQKVGDMGQEWTNPTYNPARSTNEKVYRIKVVFRTEIYGTFRQSVVLDFGTEPVYTKQLCVDSTPVAEVEKLTKDLTLSQAGRWDLATKVVIPFEPKMYNMTDDEDMELLEKYPPPMASQFSVSDALHDPEVTKENYKERMHDLLYIEEMAQFSNIAKFNVKAYLQLVDRFLLMPSNGCTAKFAQDGILFARLKLTSELSEDTAHGRLILQNVNTVYLAPHTNDDVEPTTIYEALVEEKCKTCIFLRVSKRTVDELGLKSDSDFKAQVQFQLNRLPLCEMHMAIDRLPEASLVFPNLQNMPLPWSPSKQWDSTMEDLNEKQKEAVQALTTDPEIALPPVLIVGPYGTGKTFTLAQTAMHILSQENTRVLICTHSNSAADLYVKDYLHPQVEAGNTAAKPLRVLYKHRWIQTVHVTVLQYCLKEGLAFRRPTRQEVLDHRVIVTTLGTSRYLYDLDVEGCFSHILLDEAAQAEECETIMPLTLAGKDTRIVLAGDHMQLSPEVHSTFARERGLHISFLERMYDLYSDSHPCKIMLCENYRSHSAIIDYTSELFYNNNLVASGNQPCHETFHPLTFFTARGEDVQHANSTGFYNNSEVYEVVERVVELQKSWPKSWGDFDEASIGVVSPYSDQVVRIRAELRKRKMFKISVERVLNVQGKQFRAMFLSTVRTRHTCSSDASMEDFMDYGFLSNVKLLNTAITRAQSLVAVVGDPVSLCSIGKCRKLWERFLELCNDHNSLHGITWNHLRALLDGVELKKTYILNPLAPEFIPNRLRHAAYTPPEPVGKGKFGYTFGPVPHWMPRQKLVMPNAVPPQMFCSPMMPMPYGALRPYPPPMPGTMWSPQGPVPFSSAAAKLAGPPLKLPPSLQHKQHKGKKEAGGAVSEEEHEAGTLRAMMTATSATGMPLQKPGMAHMPSHPPPGMCRPGFPPQPFFQPQFMLSPGRGPMMHHHHHPSMAAHMGRTPHPLLGHAVGHPRHMPPFTGPGPQGAFMGPPIMASGPPHSQHLSVQTSQPMTLTTASTCEAPSQQDKPVTSPNGSGRSTPQIQFLPNVCNVKAAGCNIVDDQRMLQNIFLQREVYSYILQREGPQAASNFMQMLQSQQQIGAGPKRQHSPTSRAGDPPSPPLAANCSPSKAKPKRETVSVQLEDPPLLLGARSSQDSSATLNGLPTEEFHQPRGWPGEAASQPSSHAAGKLTYSKALSAFPSNKSPPEPYPNNQPFSSTSSQPAMNGLLTTYSPTSNGYSRLSDSSSSTYNSMLSDTVHTREDLLQDQERPLAVDHMMRFIEEGLDIPDHSLPPSNLGQDSVLSPSLGPVERQGPLYMRRTSRDSPTGLSYAGALRSQPVVTPPPTPTPTTVKLTASQFFSSVREHQRAEAQQQQQQQQQQLQQDPLDLLKNLNIKASPGTQALYQYFS